MIKYVFLTFINVLFFFLVIYYYFYKNKWVFFFYKILLVFVLLLSSWFIVFFIQYVWIFSTGMEVHNSIMFCLVNDSIEESMTPVGNWDQIYNSEVIEEINITLQYKNYIVDFGEVARDSNGELNIKVSDFKSVDDLNNQVMKDHTWYMFDYILWFFTIVYWRRILWHMLTEIVFRWEDGRW